MQAGVVLGAYVLKARQVHGVWHGALAAQPIRAIVENAFGPGGAILEIVARLAKPV